MLLITQLDQHLFRHSRGIRKVNGTTDRGAQTTAREGGGGLHYSIY